MTAPIFRLLPDPAAPLAAMPVVTPVDQHPTTALARTLLTQGLVSPHDLMTALAAQGAGAGRLADILVSRGMVAEKDLFRAMARAAGADYIDPALDPPDTRLVDLLGVTSCLRDQILPWRNTGSATVIICPAIDDFIRHRQRLTAIFGHVIMALAPKSEIDTALRNLRGAQMDHAAQHRVPAAESCRDWGRGITFLWLLVICAAFAVIGALLPLAMAYAFTAWAALTLLLATALKTAAAIAALRRPATEPPAPIIARQPVVSIMVALYREGNIAPRLIRRLGKLDYPRDLLDILLVVEEDDDLTRKALADADLPPWMRVIVVPDGRLKTKPRALNYALEACRGTIIGIYDAEDAPAPDQIRRVVDRFHRRGPDVACLQGILDFYNPRTNWLSRCFTIEYATWFRIILPGMQRLGLPIPLGGTTLFFRRDALISLGAWDAHNVTEDADLGMRLARHGYRTELIDTVTEEEANCHVIPWVRQRSRWLKGYMITYAVHMRDPLLLLRQLGLWKFLGFQVFFATTLSQFILAPVLWSFWLVPLGYAHPVAVALPPAVHLSLMALYLFTEVLLVVLSLIALRLTGHRMNPLWVAMLHVYFPLGALASYKAVWELVSKPFYWDKTSHGHYDPLA